MPAYHCLPGSPAPENVCQPYKSTHTAIDSSRDTKMHGILAWTSHGTNCRRSLRTSACNAALVEGILEEFMAFALSSLLLYQVDPVLGTVPGNSAWPSE